jgi:hypothetical protein
VSRQASRSARHSGGGIRVARCTIASISATAAAIAPGSKRSSSILPGPRRCGRRRAAGESRHCRGHPSTARNRHRIDSGIASPLRDKEQRDGAHADGKRELARRVIPRLGKQGEAAHRTRGTAFPPGHAHVRPGVRTRPVGGPGADGRRGALSGVRLPLAVRRRDDAVNRRRRRIRALRRRAEAPHPQCPECRFHTGTPDPDGASPLRARAGTNVRNLRVFRR